MPGGWEVGKRDWVQLPLFGVEPAFGGCTLDISSPRPQCHVASPAAAFNRAPAGLRRDLAADIIQVNISTTTLEVDTSGNPGRAGAAAPGLDLGGFQVSRHIDDKIIGALMIPSA